MIKADLREYLTKKGFVEVERNTFNKTYKVRESFDESKNYIIVQYKVSKGVLYFKYKQHGRSETVRKGDLEKVFINSNGEIEGLKQTLKYTN